MPMFHWPFHDGTQYLMEHYLTYLVRLTHLVPVDIANCTVRNVLDKFVHACPQTRKPFRCQHKFILEQ